MTTNINWKQDDAALMIIRSKLGIEVETATIYASQIDRKLSEQNRARKILLDKDRAALLAQAQLEGIPIPMIVVRKIISQKTGVPAYVIVGGVHREYATTAINKLADPIPVHCITCTQKEFELLCPMLNTYVGEGITKSERLEKAAEAVERLGMSHKDAALLFNITPSDVSMTISLRKFKDVHSLRDRVTSTHIRAIREYQRRSPVLSKAWADLLNSSKITAKEIRDLSGRLDNLPSEDESLSVLEKEKEVRQKIYRKPVTRAIRKTFLSAFGSIENCLAKHQTLDSLEILDEEKEGVRQRCKAIANILNNL